MAKKLYRVRFFNEDKVYEIYAKHCYQGDLYGFVIVEDLIFGETTSLVVDPQEERLKSEFDGVRQTYIPMHAVVRIDQVEKEGVAKVTSIDGKVASFPGPVYTPKKIE